MKKFIKLAANAWVLIAVTVFICLTGAFAQTASQPGLNPPVVPDSKLSPGDTLAVTAADICVPGYSKKVRNVPQSVKEAVYKEYGISQRESGEYEIDHIISLELGGSNSIKNLFPESYRTQPWNARVKDKLENRLHALVCTNKLDLETAQRAISTDWIVAYKKYVQETPDSVKENNSATTKPGNSVNSTSTVTDIGNKLIIGNKNSHKYHFPNCPSYDKVAPANQVKFTTAKEAEAAGYTLAGNCHQ